MSCGHPFGAHQHYRQGTDCSQCGCPRFRRKRELRKWWTSVTGERRLPLVPQLPARLPIPPNKAARSSSTLRAQLCGSA